MAHTKVTQEYNEMKGITTRYTLLPGKVSATSKGYTKRLQVYTPPPSLSHVTSLRVCVCAMVQSDI